ncbi:MAG: patatin-like phospholipase family protein [Flavobacteriaceae bacterium]
MRQRLNTYGFAVVIIGFFWCQMINAQDEGADDDVKIGLVLSGGGAKGMAHIGALKVIEEAGVKIDFIGGTSMGAIVGGLYASGYSAAELDSIFRSTDFNQIIQDNFPRGNKSFYDKEDDERYALSLPFDNFKITFPKGISSGQNIYNKLVKLMYHVRDVEDFNRLPIPFFCMATDVVNGTEVLLNKGYLPAAVLASGAFPSLFEPEEINDQTLIDGGVLNNYPIEEVRAMGADIVIGVDVQHSLRDKEALKSASDILLQINNYRTVSAMKEKAGLTDIYIKPDMEDYSVIDFDKIDTILSLGENAARKKWTELKELSGKEHMGDLPKAGAEDSVKISSLVIEGNQNYSRGYVKGKLRFEPEEKISFEELKQGINNLAATGNFINVRYELTSEGEGDELKVILRENPNKTLLRLGVHYDDLYKTAALINITRKNLLLKDDVASFDFMLGDNIRYNFQYYVDKGSYWSYGVSSRLDEFKQEINVDVFRSNFRIQSGPAVNNINLDIADVTNQIYLQTAVREEFALRLGIEHKFISYSTTTLTEISDPPVIPENSSGDRTFFEKSHYFSTYGGLVLDTYDDRYFPTKGLYFNGDFHLYLFSSDFNNNFQGFSVAKARMGGAFPLLENLSLNLETEGGFKLGQSEVTTFDFVLGGFGNDLINNFMPFLGYDFLALPGNSYVKAYGRLDMEFVPKNHFTFSVNIANVDDDLFRTGEWFTAPNFTGYAVGYGWESFLGPVQVVYSWTPEINDGNFFFSIGYWF